MRLFFPITKLTTVKCLLVMATAKNWQHQLDVNNAFIYGDLDKEIYMELPFGFGAKRGGGGDLKFAS
jgi:hypothetical protein